MPYRETVQNFLRQSKGELERRTPASRHFRIAMTRFTMEMTRFRSEMTRFTSAS